MKKQLLFLSLSVCTLLCVRNAAQAQIVGTECYLQGSFLEIGMSGNGSMGGSASPVGYHAHPNCCTTVPTAGGQLAEVYDYGHDGWAVGSPAFMGDYTYPGSPFEGWELQIGTSRAQAFNGGSFTGGLGLTGAFTGYTNASGSAIAYWTGSALSGQLVISIQTRLDTNASWVMSTIKMRNTGATSIDSVYYVRTCDPDIDASWTGGSFSTNNSITYQNDAMHRVMVSGRGTLSSSYYFGLSAIDSRAKAFIYTTWPLSSAVDLSTIADESYTGATYAVGSASYGDIAFGLLYNLGNIAAGDSVTLSYSYIFNDTTGIDSVAAMLCGGPLVAGTAVPDMTTACSSSTVSFALAGASSFAVTAYQWQSSPDSTTWTNIAGATGSTYSFTGLAASTYYRCMVWCTETGASDFTPGVLITFDPTCSCTAAAGIVVPSVAVACSTTVINLNDAGYTNTGTTLQWQASLDSATWTDIAATTVPYSFSGLMATTFYRLKVTCITTGASVVSPGKRITYSPCGGTTGTMPVSAPLSGVQLYPNPVKDLLTVKVDISAFTQLVIANAMGQQLIRQDITAADTKVNVAQLPAGVYSISLTGAHGSMVQRFVKW